VLDGWKVRRGKNPAVLIVEVPFRRNFDWRQSLLFVTDAHYDSPLCDRGRLKRVMDQSMEAQIPWFHTGDWYDAMGGKYDPRSSKGEIRPEYVSPRYFDAIVDDSAKFLKPYAPLGLMMSPGNHEVSVLQRHEVDLTERTIVECNRNGGDVARGTYEGWIVLRFRDIEASDKSKTTSLMLYYHHGHGGGGDVTLGTIQGQRRTGFLPDADFVLSGHVHKSHCVERVRERVSVAGDVWWSTQWHVTSPGFKLEQQDKDGWHVRMGRQPTATGGYWLDFAYDHRLDRVYGLPRKAQ